MLGRECLSALALCGCAPLCFVGAVLSSVGGWTRKSSCQVLSHLYHLIMDSSPLEVGTPPIHPHNALAKSLSKKNVAIPMEDRAAFAKAVKETMDALAKQS